MGESKLNLCGAQRRSQAQTDPSGSLVAEPEADASAGLRQLVIPSGYKNHSPHRAISIECRDIASNHLDALDEVERDIFCEGGLRHPIPHALSIH
jgi:hypothetical protein